MQRGFPVSGLAVAEEMSDYAEDFIAGGSGTGDWSRGSAANNFF